MRSVLSSESLLCVLGYTIEPFMARSCWACMRSLASRWPFEVSSGNDGAQRYIQGRSCVVKGRHYSADRGLCMSDGIWVDVVWSRIVDAQLLGQNSFLVREDTLSSTLSPCAVLRTYAVACVAKALLAPSHPLPIPYRTFCQRGKPLKRSLIQRISHLHPLCCRDCAQLGSHM